MKNLEEKLKNPVWYSLKETHNNFAINYNGVLFYKPEINNFGAFKDERITKKAMEDYSKLSDKFFLVSESSTPNYDSEKIQLEKKIDGCQLVLEKFIDYKITEEIIELTEKHIDEIYDLIWLVMPGFYQKKGFYMGKFFGIFKENKLVAISGQRMQTNDFIEVSSVVTHPEHTKRGYAKQLITYTTKEIIKENKLPMLHTNKGNKAIPLYEKLGYKLTRDMNWWLFSKK